MTAPVLELRNISKTFQLPRKGGWFAGHIDHHAVRDVSLTLPRNTILGLVGGIMGFVKAQSTASLIAGGISGLLLVAAGFLLGSKPAVALGLGLVVSLLLVGFFGKSLLTSDPVTSTARHLIF